MAQVALVKGSFRENNIIEALTLLGDKINLKDKATILVKPNIVSYRHMHASTDAEALKAVLEFLREQYKGKIVIGEGTGFPAMTGYKELGYMELAKKYNAELVDLSEGPWTEVNVYDRKLNRLKLNYSRTVANCDYRISLCLPKTHDSVRVSLSIKNLAMASLRSEVPSSANSVFRDFQRRFYEKIPPWIKYSAPLDTAKKYVVSKTGANDRVKMHQGYPVHNLNLYLLQRAFPVHLAVIDAFCGMEGDGPIIGKKVDWNLSVASTDAVAADSLMAYLMGFNPLEIGYIYYCSRAGLGCSDIKAMTILGERPENCLQPFLPSPIDEEQRHWKDNRIEELFDQCSKDFFC